MTTPLDSRNLARLIATLEEVDRAVTVAHVHLCSGCPDAARQELGHARIALGHARRIAEGPARDAIPDEDERRALHRPGSNNA